MSQNVFRESNAPNTEAAPQPPSFLQKKGLLGKNTSLGSTMSPTDNFMSPVSAKLSGAKQRHFQKGTNKPLPFASKLSSLAASGSPLNSPAQAEKKAGPF